MALNLFVSNSEAQSKKMLNVMLMALITVTMFAMPDMLLAAPNDITATQDKVCGLFGGINQLLNAASIIVVTIAIIFSGYQIAFAHKRISEVSPILIGGLLIGAAAQIAKMMIGGTDACSATSGAATGMVMHYLSMRYA